MSAARFVDGNRIRLLRNGTEYFPALIEAIDGARREVFLETYIYEPDATGTAVGEALKRAARRGVATHLLIDGFGSNDLAPEVVQDLLDAGVQALFYRQELARFRMRRHRLRRLHRKIAAIDGRTAFVGGINIIDDQHTPGQIPPRYDYAVRVEGPLLGQIHPSVRRLWAIVAWARFQRRWAVPLHARTAIEPQGTQRAAFVIRDNLRHRREIEQAYLHAIRGARREVIIANAYFLPGVHFRRALMEAARRGVRVVLLLQGRVEYVLMHYASRALYGSLLEAGVEIHEYHKSFLHAKVAVVDGRWATVGSSNIDPFSLMLAREANVVVDDVAFAEELRASLLAAMAEGSQQILPEDWKRLPLALRAAAWSAYGMVRLMMGMAGYGAEDPAAG